MVGENLPPLVIDKSANLRCFKSIKKLPLPYKSNKKAWMTVIIFEVWVKKLDSRMRKNNRTVAFVRDNCTTHPNVIKVTNVKFIFLPSNTRGGVEDTRLEAKAKAKDTKKIRGQGQGQGQPFRGQTLSRPRTGMLEAKAKDQGHRAQVLSKKKKRKRSSQKFFRRSPKKKKKKKKKRSSQKFFKRSPRKNAFQIIFQPLHKILTFQKIVLSSSRGQANFRGLEASRPRPRTWPSRPRPRPRTSKCVLEDVLEAKDVLEDSTSV